MPTVVFMHGCTGINELQKSDARALAAEDYAVFMPDSFARTARPKDCDSETKEGGFFPQVLEFRLAEIRYAASRLKALPWVDRSRLFLVGFSEGGNAVAHYDGDEFAGHVVIGWTCHMPPELSHRAGVRAPPGTPVLAIVGSDDPWFRAPSLRGHCGDFMAGRTNARSIIVEDRGHHVVQKPKAWRHILHFLEKHRKQS